MPERTVQVDALEILRYDYPEIEIDIVCGSGTYIRTLGIDLAVAAGSTAVMTYLCRLGIGEFKREDAISMEQLREGDLESMLLPASRAVTQLPKLEINDDESIRLGHGLCVDGDPTPDADPTGRIPHG